MEEQTAPDPLTQATLVAHAKTHEVYRLQAALDQVEEIVRELLLAAPKVANDTTDPASFPGLPCEADVQRIAEDLGPVAAGQLWLDAHRRYNKALSRMVDWLITHTDPRGKPPLRVLATIRAAIQGAIHEHSEGFTPFPSEYDAGFARAMDVWTTWYTLSPAQMSIRLGRVGEDA